jgi:hypothetical protein
VRWASVGVARDHAGDAHSSISPGDCQHAPEGSSMGGQQWPPWWRRVVGRGDGEGASANRTAVWVVRKGADGLGERGRQTEDEVRRRWEEKQLHTCDSRNLIPHALCATTHGSRRLPKQRPECAHRPQPPSPHTVPRTDKSRPGQDVFLARALAGLAAFVSFCLLAPRLSRCQSMVLLLPARGRRFRANQPGLCGSGAYGVDGMEDGVLDGGIKAQALWSPTRSRGIASPLVHAIRQ